MLLNDYGSDVMLLGSDLCGCCGTGCQLRLAWADIQQRNSSCTVCVTCLSSLCDWFWYNDIKGARPERSGLVLGQKSEY